MMSSRAWPRTVPSAWRTEGPTAQAWLDQVVRGPLLESFEAPYQNTDWVREENGQILGWNARTRSYVGWLRTWVGDRAYYTKMEFNDDLVKASMVYDRAFVELITDKLKELQFKHWMLLMHARGGYC